TINRQAVVNAGLDATICEGSDFTLISATVVNAASISWTTSGTGLFNDASVQNPIYTPSISDILNGSVVLILTGASTSPCVNVQDTMVLSISRQAIVDAGADAIICETAGAYTISNATSQFAVSYLWTSSGSGSFNNNTVLNPVYTPSAADIVAGSVTLTVVASSASPCVTATDSMVLFINRQAIVDAGVDATICETAGSYTLGDATAQFATSYQWTTTGTGSFSNPNDLNPVYTPSLNDILDGYVALTVTATSASPCVSVSDTMILNITHQAIVDAGADATICETSGTYTVSDATSQYATSYLWTTSGTGAFANSNVLNPIYTPSAADIAAGSVTLTVVASSASPCVTATDSMVLNISRQSIANAGIDTTICETGIYSLSDASAQYATSYLWTTTGTGTFSDAVALNPVYTPSANDILDGWVNLVLTTTSDAPCSTVSDTMLLNISHQATVNAGVDATICETSTYTLVTATATNSTSLLWTSSGTGTFDNSALLNATYTPSAADITSGSVVLTIIANSAGPCVSVSDTMTLNFSLQAISSAGPNDTVCENSSYTLTGANATNATSILWVTTGSGTFADPTVINAVYTPSAADILNGSVTLSVIATSESPCANSIVDAMLLTISRNPVVYAGADTSICQNVNYYVDDATVLYSTNMYWTSNGTGTIVNGTTLNPTYVPGAGETGVITLTLHAISSVVCGSDTTTDFMYLTIMQSVIANAGLDTTIFANNSIALNGSAANGSGAYSYNWQPSSLLTYENTNHPITDPLSTTTTFILTVTDLVTGCQDIDSVVVTIDGINLPPVAVADFDTTDYQTCVTIPVLLNDYDPEGTPLTVSICGEPTYGTVIVNSDNTITYCPYDGFSGDDSFCYQICDEGSPVLCTQSTVNIHVKPEFTLEDLVIYNGVSPNGDGDNDVWKIYGIEYFPDNEATIFNRWGDVIASFTHYNNKDVSWDGTYKGKLVPDGTYYYVLDVKNKKKFSGWIYVKTGK
ncbi:MAG: gliding motility-associated C-terminal domain-containing protein, partial [Bacteroidota bacterium]